MRILHRGLTIDLPEGDARIAGIEALLFGTGEKIEPAVPPAAVPAPASAPSVAKTPASTPPVPPVTATAPILPPPRPAEPPAMPPMPPRIAVPAAWRSFWNALGPVERRELVLLAEKERRPTELEHLLKLRYGALKSRHAAIHRCAHRHGVRCLVLSRGRGREARHFHLEEELLPLIRELARRQAVLDAE